MVRVVNKTGSQLCHCFHLLDVTGLWALCANSSRAQSRSGEGSDIPEKGASWDFDVTSRNPRILLEEAPSPGM